MEFSNTMFNNFNERCIESFGESIGNKIFIDAEEKFENMVSEIDDRNNKKIRWHLEKCLLPTIAIYLSLRDRDETCENAYSITLDFSQELARENKKRMQRIGKMPFGYKLFKILSKGVITKMYPEAGWDAKWIRCDKEEVHFNYNSCLYKETTEKYNCLEMCSIFCETDVTSFSGLAPNIIFERTGTLAKGHKQCDFHFKNSKFVK